MRLGHCLAKGLCNTFLGWVEPPVWTEPYSEVLFSASFNPRLFRPLNYFTCLNPPPPPRFLANPFIFSHFHFIYSHPNCHDFWPVIIQQSTNDFSANGLTFFGIRGSGYRVTQSDWKCYKMPISRGSFLETALKNCTCVFGREEGRFCLQRTQCKTLILKSLLNCSTTITQQCFDIKKQTRS